MSPLILALLGGAAAVAVTSKKPKPTSTSQTPNQRPEGRGLFIDNIEVIESFEKIKKFVDEYKIKWISILNYEEEKDYLNIKKKGILQALSNHGIKIWLWSIPSPYSIDPFIQNSKKYEHFSFLSGYIVHLTDAFIKVPNAVSVLASTFKTKYPVGILTDKQIDLGKSKDFFKFDVYQVFDKKTLEPINGFEKSIPLYMLAKLHEENLPVNISVQTFGIWSYDEIKDDKELLKVLN